MREARTSKRFRKDYVRLNQSGRRDMSKLDEIMAKLISKETLSPLHRDHALDGEWKGYRDCHVEGDWVLIYTIHTVNGGEIVTFHATDNHSNLFG